MFNPDVVSENQDMLTLVYTVLKAELEREVAQYSQVFIKLELKWVDMFVFVAFVYLCFPVHTVCLCV